MKIAMHSSHHALPFWQSPRQPTEMFDPARHSSLVMQFSGEEKTPVSETWLWPVLTGLKAIEAPIMAHVSALCGCRGDGTFHFPKRIWVQITTLPKEKTETDIPVVVKDEKVTVKHLWGGDNGTYSPFGLLPDKDEYDPKKHTTEFWRDFFTGELHGAKREMYDDLRQKQAEAAEAQALYNEVAVAIV
jgi:hypothetical protein